MKAAYRGFDLDAHRAKSLGGETLVYWSAFKQSCKWELTSGFSDDEDSIETHIRELSACVDDYYENPEDYDHACGPGHEA